MNRKDKIEYARNYCRDLVSRYPEITAIALGGSLARGNELPISDVDLWCFVNESAEPLPIEKHFAEGVYVDIEKQPSELLVREDIREDAYVCGYLHDALILFDRDGQLAECQSKARMYLASLEFRSRQLAPMRASVERNYREFLASLATRDVSETCRSSIFAAWDLSDHMLTSKGVPPGGARGLSRLAAVWPDAAHALVVFEGSAQITAAQTGRLVETYSRVADRSSFFEMWVQKVEWMFANGYASDALHTLWIALGLRIKDAKERSDDGLRSQLMVASDLWLRTIAWNHAMAQKKLLELREMIDCYCRPEP